MGSESEAVSRSVRSLIIRLAAAFFVARKETSINFPSILRKGTENILRVSMISRDINNKGHGHNGERDGCFQEILLGAH